MKFLSVIKICLLSALCMVVNSAAAQKVVSSDQKKSKHGSSWLYATTPRGYYISDDTLRTVGELIKGNSFINSHIFRVKIANEIIEYTPKEITEYSFSNGRTYFARDITLSGKTRELFLERLSDGNASLYYYRGKGFDKYFWETENSGLVELSREKQQFKETLAGFDTDCEGFVNDLKLVSFTRASLTKLTERFNSCDPTPFPFTRFGVVAGGIAARQIPTGYTVLDFMDAFKYRYSISYSVGLFLDKPLFASDYSIHAEILYSEMSHLYSYRVKTREREYSAKYSSISIPVLLRYTFPEVKQRPFVNLGAMFNYYLKSEEILYEADIEGDIAEIYLWSPSFVSKHHIGVSLGSGIQYMLDYRKSLFLELRYNRLIGLSDQHYFNTDEIQLLTGIIF